ncbi:MAG TPA: YHS domain-containing protein [Gemmatimonadaceae bacterium]|nr:YHS domain-containing protein [Gemmatimonadaceae bacterium]
MAHVQDPVCGMMIESETAAASSVFDGETYYFCSLECRDTFEADPRRYAAAQKEARFTKSMGVPAPEFGFATSGGAEYEGPPAKPAQRKAKDREKA